MDEGTKEDYDVLGALENDYIKALPERILNSLKGLKSSLGGYQIDRYEHSLQSATLAYRDGQDEEMVVAALLHDIGDELAPLNHGEFAASILKPYVSEKTYWIIKYHLTCAPTLYHSAVESFS
jgi:predicted HD phosphohydrolase